MKLSAPIYRLKRNARLMSQDEGVPLHVALDRVAANEGYESWSLLASKLSQLSPAKRLYTLFQPGDLILIAARPGHGKTMLSLELVVEALRSKQRSVVFSLESTLRECHERLASLGWDIGSMQDRFEFDGSDDIDAGHIVSRLAHAPHGTFVVIDYLQLLDQRRESPELADQVRTLRSFAREKGLTMVFLSQIHRSYDSQVSPFPNLSNVRLPNELDLGLFDKACFLNNGALKVSVVRSTVPDS